MAASSSSSCYYYYYDSDPSPHAFSAATSPPFSSSPSPHDFSAATSPPFSSSPSLPASHPLRRCYSTHSLPPLHHYISDPTSFFFSDSDDSFPHRRRRHHHHPPPPPPPPPAAAAAPSFSSPSSLYDYFDFNSGPFRRIFSTGDLQGTKTNGPQVAGENCGQEGGAAAAAAAGKVGRRYSAEERKERIERYRSKRHQRNFHKKITYACRKTLADSRPRVRGRFARNGDAETEAELKMEAAEIGYQSLNYNNNYAHQQSECNGEWGRPTPHQESCLFLEDLWAICADEFAAKLPY